MEALAAPLAYVVTFAVLVMHAVWAHNTKCGVNFQRGGADISLVAAVLFAFVSWYGSEGFKLDGGRVPKWSLLNPNVALPLVALLGTITWGYGDMVPWFSSKGCGG